MQIKNGDTIETEKYKYRVIDDEVFILKDGAPPSFTITINGDCPYRSICSDYGIKCETCRHNPKRSYYEPVESYYPYIPYTPFYPYYPYHIWGPWIVIRDTNSANGTSYYQTV